MKITLTTKGTPMHSEIAIGTLTAMIRPTKIHAIILMSEEIHEHY